MSMIYVIHQASDADIQVLLDKPALITSFIGNSQPPVPKQPGFFARLFGARELNPKETETPSIQFEMDRDVCDLDKAWHGLHYLLTGSDWEGNPTEAFLLNWGTEVGDVDVGYGPARALTAAQTNDIHQCLSRIGEQTLRSRFDPEKMMELEIYPTIWDRDPSEDDTLGYLMEFFEQLKSFVARTQKRNYGMVAYIG